MDVGKKLDNLQEAMAWSPKPVGRKPLTPLDVAQKIGSLVQWGRSFQKAAENLNKKFREKSKHIDGNELQAFYAALQNIEDEYSLRMVPKLEAAIKALTKL